MPLETQRPTAMNNCCKDCPDRVVGCHSACDRYILAKQKHDRLMKEYKKGNEAELVRLQRYFKERNRKAMAKKKKAVIIRLNYD